MILNVVMVEPEIPQNTGNVARTCALTGARLHLVGPMDITYYENLEEFFRKNPDNGNFYYFTTKATHRHTDVKYPDNVYLFFGKETKGLPENLLHDNPQTSVRIPMLNNPDARSLNLSNSVAIGVYEVLRQWNYPKLLCEGKLRDYEWDV